MFPKNKTHKTLVIMETSQNTDDASQAISTSMRKIVTTRTEFLQLAKEWWNSRGTHFNDFDDFRAIPQPENQP